MANSSITSLFLDVGGVLLTNGWDRKARVLAVKKFGLDLEEVNERHHLTFDTYESGKLDLNEYLERVVFYEKRNFTKEEFESFMYEQSQPLKKMIEFIKELKKKHKLKVTAVSNEGRELTEYRIRQFRLNEIFDSFIASSFIHIRKPDVDIYRIALDVSQVKPQQVAYLDDRLMFVQVARSLGINGIHHKSLSATKSQLERLGLAL